MIADGAGDLSDVFDIMNMLHYEQVIDEVDNTLYIGISSWLRDALNSIDNVRSFKHVDLSDNWKTAISLLFIIADGKYDYSYISQQKTFQAYAIKYLIKQGFDIDWRERPLSPTLLDADIVSRIEALIDCIGRYRVIIRCIVGLNTQYSRNMNRYMISRNTSLMEGGYPSFPHIYLLNIALKKMNLIQPKISNEELQKAGEELDSLVKNYILCYDLESHYPMVRLGASELTNFLMKEVLFDTCYIPKQLSSKQAELLINDLFSWVKKEDTIFFKKIKQYVRIFRNLNYRLNQKKNILPIVLKQKDLHSFSIEAIKDLSISSYNVNKNYIDPNTLNLEFANAAFANPIIDCGNKQFLILPSPIFSYAFFEKIYTIIRDHIDNAKNIGYTSRNVGDKMEDLAYNSLIKNLPPTFRILKNKTYKISSICRKKHSLSRDKGECDLILETPDNIWIFEIKGKPMTTRAIMGDSDSIIFDLSKSLLTSYEQALTTKVLLLREDELRFTDGTSLYLNSRRVRTVSLTLYDYGSLHTSAFITQLLELIFRGMKLNTRLPNYESINTINDINGLFSKIRNLGEQVNKFNENAVREIIFSHQFLNSSLLLQIMDDYEGNTAEFLEVLQSMQYISCGMQDSYISYLNVKKIVDHKKLKKSK